MGAFREWVERLLGSARRGRSDEDLEAELRSHLEIANDASRMPDPQQAVRSARLRLGGSTQAMEAIRDQRGLPRLDAIFADVVFGWRQLRKHRGVTIAAVLSLGLAVGATTAAFRLVDAVLLRPMPVADPEGLFLVASTFADAEFRPDYSDSFDYPTLRRYRDAVGNRGDVMLLGSAARLSARIGSSEEPEHIYRQYVSGNVFPSFGLQPAAGRLIGPGDDQLPGAHPVAVITYDYWTRRFNRRADIAGQTLRIGSKQFEIIGVAPKGFVGTEPGRLTDVFAPSMMMTAAALDSPGWSWFRMWVRPKNGADAKEIQQIMQADFAADHRVKAARMPPETPKARVDAYLREEIALIPAASGASGVKKQYRSPLLILMTLVALVLLVACANVANLLIGQALTREKEMALRLSIGAGRGRLVQLVLIESLLLAAMATAVGSLIASWSAPLVVSMLAPPDEPVRLVLNAGWRSIAFGALLTLAVTMLFGVAPALRASSARPLHALRGGENPRGQWRLTHSLIAIQMTFSVAVLFVAGLFLTTFHRLSTQPLGFAGNGLVILDVDAPDTLEAERWAQIVGAAAVAGWTPLSGNTWSGRVVMPGRIPPSLPPYFVTVGPGYFETLGIPMRSGRDFRAGDPQPKVVKKLAIPGVGIVNDAFAKVYFDGRNPVGQRVDIGGTTMEIVGVVGDAVYRNLRERIRPQAYVPFESGGNASVVFRTKRDEAAFGTEVSKRLVTMPGGLHVDVTDMTAVVRRQLLRERLLAILSMFFAGVAVLLAGVGLYGVSNHAVIRQRREIGIRLALGAGAGRIVGHVTGGLFLMISIGAAAGLAAGVAGGRFVESLLFGVRATEPSAVIAPLAALFGAAAVAALPAALRASRLNPSKALRSE
jgi:putative ABC transport system permease protein